MKRSLLYMIVLVVTMVTSISAQQLYAPFLPGETWTCVQGNNGSFSHQGTTGKYGLYYAWDFSWAGNFQDIEKPVLASASGTVANIVFDGTLGTNQYGGGDANCSGMGSGFGFTIQILTDQGTYRHHIEKWY